MAHIKNTSNPFHLEGVFVPNGDSFCKDFSKIKDSEFVKIRLRLKTLFVLGNRDTYDAAVGNVEEEQEKQEANQAVAEERTEAKSPTEGLSVRKAKAFIADCSDSEVLALIGQTEERNSVLQAVQSRLSEL